ncbi:Binding-protein-dependent transport system inner membrane component [Neomoorella glycerini]|uniref:Binding-protein-dependent transport system inner membrane component n=1 Tax=Neomoorella glycerini TaxID=55779 RepID=A0A6I5ZR62_9FIRM|nr:ABC transporter permease subunit [Moorella glycerini]QGP92473.1 Binding-protein-dependent transport system inner membrane component [Moorella glycerini]
MPDSRRALSYLASILFLFGLWWLLAVVINNPGLPGPFPALQSLVKVGWPVLARHLYISTYRVLGSLALALIIAVPLGLWAGRHPAFDSFLAPLVYLLYPVPKVALLPVAMVLLGIGDGTRMLVIFLVIVNQILITTRDAARQIPPQLLLSVASLGAGKISLYRQVILPACLPEIITASRISLGSAIAVLFLSETIAGNSGLGYFILDGLFRADYGAMFAGILAMAGMGLVLYMLLNFLEYLLCPWQRL